MSDSRLYSNKMSDDIWVEQAEANLWELANGATGEQEKLDKEGNVHNLHFRLPPNFDANKLILKNKSNGRWVDKVEATSTQINVNLTASYDEVNRLLEKQKIKQIEQAKDVVIDVVVEGLKTNDDSKPK